MLVPASTMDAVFASIASLPTFDGNGGGDCARVCSHVVTVVFEFEARTADVGPAAADEDKDNRGE